MRLVTLAVALALAAALAPPPAAASTTLSCTPPPTLGWQALPCSVEGQVNSRFEVRIYFASSDVGPVLVRAEYQYGVPGLSPSVHFVCAGGMVVAVCSFPVFVGEAWAGWYRFTAQPLVANMGGHAVTMEVVID